MNKRLLLTALMAATVPSPFALAQGVLNPPGAPAPTMKTLEQVEPRIPIDPTRTPGDANATFRINAAGSYYLTGNITGESGKVGILVTANNVTIDLNGFSLTGAGNSSGIDTPAGGSGPENTTVRNGTVTNWGFGARLRDKARVERVSFLRNTGAGLVCGQAALIVDCVATDNGESGITAGRTAVIRSTVAHANSAVGLAAGTGSVVTNCAANLNSGFGIQTQDNSTVQGCSADGNSSTGINTQFRSTIVDCTSTNNGVFGISTLDSSTVQRCSVSKNRGEAGIKVGARCHIIESVADENGSLGNGDGISALTRAVVKRCSATANRRNGIFVLGESIVIDNRASDNGKGIIAAGIFTSFGGATGSRVESNQTRDNFGNGIRSSDGDVVIRNTAGNNSDGNYFPASGPNMGPVSTNVSGATHPLANIAF